MVAGRRSAAGSDPSHQPRGPTVRRVDDVDLGFDHVARKSGDVVIRRDGVEIVTLRGKAAARFLADVAAGDPQQVMARFTGNYRRGNERVAGQHRRNRSR